ncbi:MAG TPA: DNA-3-methyladenine glycosylase I [Candidatus Methylomirabilis sp.]|nr:DNA-3-methyladenine glycosylase I [Candidatus Methylomirabilis sp.]
MTSDKTKIRCEWATGNALQARYHDTEWGVPSRDDRHLFEMLILEGAQAGLSWDTILRKRDNYRRAFAQFDPVKVARFDRGKRGRLLSDPGIVRNRMKIEAAVINAKMVGRMRDEYDSFGAYIWQFVDGKPVKNAWTSHRQVPAETPQSRLMSKDLTRRGFKFVGPTICYAFMQAVGLVNDHVTGCFRYRQV